MALNNNDLFLVNQGGVSKKLTYEKLKENIDADGIAGVSKIVAGNNITISPTDGTGVVTINGQAGGGGGEGGDTIINYNGAAAWATINGNATLSGNNLNIASVVRTPGGNAAGDYTITFTTAMPDGGYTVTTNSLGTGTAITSKTAQSFRVQVYGSDGTTQNLQVSFAVHALNALPPQGGTGADAWVVGGSDGSIVSSFNIATVDRITTGTYSVRLQTSMPTADYAVVVSTVGAGNREWGVDQRTNNGFRLYCYKNGALDDVGFSAVVHATNASLPATITEDQIAALIQNPALSAWGNIASDGSLNQGFNCTTSKIANGRYRVAFINPLPNANYSVVTDNSSSNTSCRFTNLNTDAFEIQTLDSTASFADAPVSFQVAGTARNGTLGGGADAWASTTGAAVLLGGFNLTVVGDGAGVFTYTFVNPMPNANYSVVAQPNNATFATARVYNKTATGFQALFQDCTPATQGNVLGADHSLAVFSTDGNAGGFWVKTGDELAPINDAIDVKIGGGDISLNNDGSAEFAGNISAGNITFNLDDGSELAVKDRVLNLISRLDAIEANEMIDDAVDTSLLSLLASASARLDSIEARLAALEGGN